MALLNVTSEELRALAEGDVLDGTREKAGRLLVPVPPEVIPGQTTIDDHLGVDDVRAA